MTDEEPEPLPTGIRGLAVVTTSVLLGLWLEALDEGPFSLIDVIWKALTFCLIYAAIVFGWPYVKRFRTSNESAQR
jgi:hypothetical protein